MNRKALESEERAEPEVAEFVTWLPRTGIWLEIVTQELDVHENPRRWTISGSFNHLRSYFHSHSDV